MNVSKLMIIFVLCVTAYYVLFVLNAARIAFTAAIRRPIGRYMRQLREMDSYCPLDGISREYQWTVARMEDPRFGSHLGIDLHFTGSAIKKNIRARKWKKHGGSTITQQLAKNLYLTPEKTYTRKLAELFLAFYLEAKLTKAQILELYVNVIYYGHEQYGVLPAAKYYFGVNPAELSLNQSVTLASILPCPDKYNPIDDPLLFRKARQIALSRLAARGVLPEGLSDALNHSVWRDARKDLKIENIEEQMPFSA